MKTLKKCCNGCDAPPQSPSKVLCKKCLDELSASIEQIGRDFEVKQPPTEGE
jgi:hypothetical protein